MIRTIINGQEVKGPRVSSLHMEVLLLLSNGKKAQDIAEILEIKPTSVYKHIESIKDRLGANTASGAVAIAIRKGLIK